jgi:hypothetical protein
MSSVLLLSPLLALWQSLGPFTPNNSWSNSIAFISVSNLGTQLASACLRETHYSTTYLALLAPFFVSSIKLYFPLFLCCLS